MEEDDGRRGRVQARRRATVAERGQRTEAPEDGRGWGGAARARAALDDAQARAGEGRLDLRRLGSQTNGPNGGTEIGGELGKKIGKKKARVAACGNPNLGSDTMS
jgi:hypothetical protein